MNPEYERNGFPTDEQMFICKSEREFGFTGRFNDKGVPHQSVVIPESITKVIKDAVEQEVKVYGKANLSSGVVR